MKTYTFKVIVEPDEDQWHAYCPALKQFGAVTCGDTKEEAYRHIHEVVEMIVEELNDEGVPIPESPHEDVVVFPDSRIAVMI